MLSRTGAPTKFSSANFGGDGGDLINAFQTGDIPQPYGYPIYIIIGNTKVGRTFLPTFHLNDLGKATCSPA